MHIGLIGFGSIANTLAEILAQSPAQPLEQITVLVRKGKAPSTRESVQARYTMVANHCTTIECVKELTNASPDLVLECAGHRAVYDYLPEVLGAAIPTVVASVGALADDTLHTQLKRIATEAGTQLVIPSGAIGALDILSAVSQGPVQSVVYSARKPAMAWSGTPASDVLDLPTLTGPAVIYEGTARTAARDYPKNANVAAALALAGIGFDRTHVRLIADPDIQSNIHEYSVESDAANFTVRIEGKPTAENPKTSMPTVYSLAREVLNRLSPVVV